MPNNDSIREAKQMFKALSDSRATRASEGRAKEALAWMGQSDFDLPVAVLIHFGGAVKVLDLIYGRKNAIKILKMAIEAEEAGEAKSSCP